MKQIRIQMLREFLSTQANHWAFFPVVILFAETERPDFLCLICWFFLGLMPLALFIAREIVQSFILQVASFFIIGGVLALLPLEPAFLKATYLFFAMIYLMMSLFKMIKKDNRYTMTLPLFFPMCINIILSIIAVYVNHLHFSFYMHFAAIISICMALLANYVEHYLVFTIGNEETSSNMPSKKIFHSGIAGTIQFVGLLIIPLMVIASFSISDEFFRLLMHGGQQGIKKFILFLRKFFSSSDRQTFIRDGGESEPFQRAVIPEQQPSMFWMLLEKLAFAGVMLLLLYGLYLILMKILGFLHSYQKSKVLIEVAEETEDIDVHEDLSPSSVIIEEEDDSFLSPTQRIRRLYRKKALSTNHEINELWRMTAREIATEEESPQIAYVYEKARYSRSVCTADDLKEMQAACRRKRKSEE